MQRTTRRRVFQVIAGAAAGAHIAEAQHQHGGELVQVDSAYAPQVLDASEMKWLAVLADAIIPRTDTPGASDAGVPAFIDRRLHADPALAARFREGMALLDAAAIRQFGSRFSALDAAQITAVLTPHSTQQATPLGRFFRTAKDLTIEGYYASREGLSEELGWHGNTYLPEYPGCTHPEHQG